MIKNYIKLTLTSLLLISIQAKPMSIFDAGKAYLFSPVKVVITSKGKPIISAKVIRRWEWKDKLIEDNALTNDIGLAELPEIRERSITQVLPVQFFVPQQMSVVIEDKEHVFWENAKVTPEINSELEGIPLILDCDLDRKEETYRHHGAKLYTKCIWKKGKDHDA